MPVQQITAFLEDRPHALEGLLDLLAEGDINICALSMAETRDYGVLRLIVTDHERAVRVLHEGNVPVREVPVIAAEIGDHPGALAKVVALLASRDVDVHYCYAFFTLASQKAWVIFRVADPEFATSVLERNRIRTLTQEDLLAGAAASLG